MKMNAVPIRMVTDDQRLSQNALLVSQDYFKGLSNCIPLTLYDAFPKES